jgi:hypothetical protein
LEITKQVSWPNHEPLVFYLRRGRRAANWPEIYERQHSPENVKAMADAGVRYGRLHFYKGFGLETEMPEISKTRQMAELNAQVRHESQRLRGRNHVVVENGAGDGTRTRDVQLGNLRGVCK